jgi:hypothetical protein
MSKEKYCLDRFIVTCKECNSINIEIENGIGYSNESGSWGSLDLICADCGNREEVYKNDF